MHRKRAVNCGHLTKDSLRKTETMAFGPSMGRTMAMIPILVRSIRSTMSAQCRRYWVGAGTTILRTWELPSRWAYFPLQFVQLTSLLTTSQFSLCLLCEGHILSNILLCKCRPGNCSQYCSTANHQILLEKESVIFSPLWLFEALAVSWEAATIKSCLVR